MLSTAPPSTSSRPSSITGPCWTRLPSTCCRATRKRVSRPACWWKNTSCTRAPSAHFSTARTTRAERPHTSFIKEYHEIASSDPRQYRRSIARDLAFYGPRRHHFVALLQGPPTLGFARAGRHCRGHLRDPAQ